MSLGLVDQSQMLRALWALDVIGKKPESFRAPQDMRFHISMLDKLPPLSETARRVLELRTDPTASAAKLAAVVEQDPPLAAQVIRWSNSAYFGQRGNVLSVKDAINRVLGYDLVLNLAFGLCSLRPLKAPKDGMLGTRFFWRQTLGGTRLAQMLIALMPAEDRPSLTTLQLIYLLHNTGHLLLAHLFRREFNYLIEINAANPKSPLLPVERFSLGVDHCQLGAWLMQTWRMPESLQIVVQHHHNPYYRGEHEKLVWLTCLVDRLLGKIDIGDACNTPIDDTPLYEELNIDPALADACVIRLAEQTEELNQAAAQLVG